jgi:hypothetical protein
MSLRASQKTPFDLFYWIIRVSHDDLGSTNGISVNERILMSLRAFQKSPFQLSNWKIRLSHHDLGSTNGIRINPH